MHAKGTRIPELRTAASRSKWLSTQLERVDWHNWMQDYQAGRKRAMPQPMGAAALNLILNKKRNGPASASEGMYCIS